ncbi:MAG: hypothetical protein O2963_00105 [Proteobacteria bacterium]|nr:hypothetical protein [Pseudomonadota bacterium]
MSDPLFSNLGQETKKSSVDDYDPLFSNLGQKTSNLEKETKKTSTDDFDYDGLFSNLGQKTSNIGQETKKSSTLFSGLGGDKKDAEPKGIFKAIDILQRPNFAVAGAAKELVEGGSALDVLKEAKKGFLGEERDTFTDVLSSTGWEPTSKMGKVAKGVTGFALDVLLDPTTYLGVGAITKTGLAAQKVGKLAATSTKQAQLGQRALVQFMGKEVIRGEKVFEKTGEMLDIIRNSNIGDKIGVAEIPGFRPGGVDPEIWAGMTKVNTAAKNVRIARESSAMNEATKMYILINKYAPEATTEELANLLTKIEKPNSKIKLPDGLNAVAKSARSYLDELGKIRKKAGKSLLNSDDLEYLPHIHKQDLVSDLQKVFGKSRVHSTSDPSDIQRSVFNFTDEGGNTLLGKADEFNLRKSELSDDLFISDDGIYYTKSHPTIQEKLKKYPNIETHLPTLLATAGRRVGKLEEAGIYFDGVSHLSVNKGGLDTFTKLSDAKAVKAPELKGLKFNKALAREIDSYYTKVTDQKEIAGMLKLYDNVQNLWKGSATFINAAFHSRNVISNMFQNALGGVKSYKSYKKATQIQAYLKSGKQMPKKLAKYWDDYNKNGLDTTFFGTDIASDIKNQFTPRISQATERLGGPIDAASRAVGTVFKKGADVGSFLETNARLTHFIDKIDKGFISEEAAKSVKKFLFDYTELTDFEKNVMKRLVPFYTWTRKNIPLQLEMLAAKPRFAVGIGKAKQNIEKNVGVQNIDQSLLPEWLQKSEPIILGERDGKIIVTKLEGYIPITDLGMLSPDEIGRQMLGMLSPFIKFVPQMMANYNFFLEEKIKQFPGEKKDLLRMKVNPYLDFAARQIRTVGEFDKLFGKPHKEVSKSAKMINLFLGGKIYHIDKARQRRTNQFLRTKKASTLKAAAKKARQQGDPKEANRLMKLRQETLRKK